MFGIKTGRRALGGRLSVAGHIEKLILPDSVFSRGILSTILSTLRLGT